MAHSPGIKPLAVHYIRGVSNARIGPKRLVRALTIAAFLPLASLAASLDQDATYQVQGLTQALEIKVDEWGVPHIYGQDHYDVFFGQGFNAARDRLWQIDLWRKRGLGELAATFGADYLKQDEAARLFLYRGDMYAEWLAYGNDAKRISEAFVAGINAFVDLTGKHPHLLPPEFKFLGYRPSRWDAADVVRIRSNGLWRNVVDEVWRAQLACQGQLKASSQWRQLEPTWETQIPQGLDPCLIPAEASAKYRLAKAPVDFKRLIATLNNEPGTATAPPGEPSPAEQWALEADFNRTLGSNNWVVAPDRTSTNRPILADDPHRAHAAPSLRYIAHLVGPGIDVIGAGEPALPGISIGHNDRIAFGLTIFPIDQEDLYVYEKKDAGYRYGEHVEPFRTLSESITIKGGIEHTFNFKFTRHGPVVHETPTHAFAVRAAWLEPGMSPYFGSVEYMRAQNWREFVGALNRWGAPSENQVYADVDGNIGYKPAGRFPVRTNWDGLLPVPGDGSYEWDGYFDMDVLPEEYNPKRGFTGTANSMNLPEDYPIDRYRVGFEWSDPWRYNRLWEVLEQQDNHSMADSLALQRDVISVLARGVLAKLPEIQDHAGGELLANWDYALNVDSPAAALWNVWYTRYLNGALAPLVMRPRIPMPQLDSQTILKLLDTEMGRTLAYVSLAAAYAETGRLLGADHKAWRWGDLHQIKFRHPLLELKSLNPELKRRMTFPDYPRGGSGFTANANGYRANDFKVVGGASFRMVVDVGNWDAALATNAPGQSGDPRSPFYQNLLENWATESQFPLIYSKKAVDKHTVFTIRLTPIKPVR